jgi:biopolymer transport protein ExbD
MYFRKEEEENYSLELTPLVDVVFLLLIFFMVSTAFVDFPRQMDIALPSSKTAQSASEPSKIEIEMNSAKNIFLNGIETTLSELEVAIKKVEGKEKAQALIRADKNLPYGEVIGVMGILQGENILDISVAIK